MQILIPNVNMLIIYSIKSMGIALTAIITLQSLEKHCALSA